MEEPTSWVATQVQHVSKQKVWHWAAFDAYLFLLYNFLELWVVSQVKSMTDSLGVQQNSIIKLIIGSWVALSAMEVHIKSGPHGLRLGFGLINLGHEKVYLWRKILLIDHVKSNDHISIIFGFESSIDLHLNVVFSYDF